MAGFGRIAHVVNRSLEILEVTDDGIPWPIRPGYKAEPALDAAGDPVLDEEGRAVVNIVGAGPGGTVYMEPLPYFAAERAKRQNPVMGTEDPYNPSDFQSLIAVPEWGDDYSPIQQSDAIERLDRSLLPDDMQKVTVIAARGGRKKVVRKNPKSGKFEKVVPGGRSMVEGEARENLTGMAIR